VGHAADFGEALLQACFVAGTHVHGLGGKPDGIDGNLGFEGFGYRLSIQQAVQLLVIDNNDRDYLTVSVATK